MAPECSLPASTCAEIREWIFIDIESFLRS